ncbi:MAG: ATP-binding protein [Tepidanaerobacteraceae bacterium]
MAIRKIVHIDEEKCNGCGICIPACAEGAIKIIDGKARLVSDNLCDGLGSCLGECPQGAISIIEREADDFDEEAAKEHVSQSTNEHQTKNAGLSCPSSKALDMREQRPCCPASQSRVINSSITPSVAGEDIIIKSQLKTWPVQLMLAPTNAPYFDGADLLILADCAAVAYPSLHPSLLKGKVALMGCPKLDDAAYYIEKLSNILKSNQIKSISVAHMEVPCCFGMVKIVEEALKQSGKDIPMTKIKISVGGNVCS